MSSPRLKYQEWYYGVKTRNEPSFVERRREELAAEAAAAGEVAAPVEGSGSAGGRWDWPESPTEWMTLPLRLAFIYTCPDCTEVWVALSGKAAPLSAVSSRHLISALPLDLPH